MNYFKKFNYIKNKGFTLAELLVGLTVFSLVVAAASGVFISAIRAQKEALAWQELLDQTSYLEEYISRALRMAKKDTVGSCTGTPNLNYKKTTNGIKFLNHKDICQEFFLTDSRLKESKSGATALPLTSDRLTVNVFNIQGDNISGENTWDQDDNFQPRVTLLLEIEGRGQGLEQPPRIKIQTTVSQRDLDVEY